MAAATAETTHMDIDPSAPSAAVAAGAAPTNINTDMQTRTGATAVRSIEGWIIMATNLHEECDEEIITELFGEWGDVKQVHLNLDRRTGYVKGYALIEYATLREARAAIDNAHGTTLLDQELSVDFAFVRPPPGVSTGGGDRRGGRERRERDRRDDRDRDRERDREDYREGGNGGGNGNGRRSERRGGGRRRSRSRSRSPDREERE